MVGRANSEMERNRLPIEGCADEDVPVVAPSDEHIGEVLMDDSGDAVIL